MELKQFLSESYTSYHTVANVTAILRENGFERLYLGEKWNLKRDGKYYVTRNDSSVIAFRLGANRIFNLAVSHTDSPSLKVKGNSVIVSESVSRINTETYGSALLYSFFDRPLKIAGRLLLDGGSKVVSELTVSDFNVVIPSLAIHHNPTANKEFCANPQVDMLPLLGQGKKDVYSSLTDKKVLDADLYVVPYCEPFESGADGEFLSSPRLDNLTSVYAETYGLINASPKDIAVVVCLDNEEIGSGTKQGNPAFVEQTLNAIARSCDMDEFELRGALENGLALSVDNGHAVHPAHPEKSDPVNKVYMNGGVVFKHHTNYATDGLSASVIKKILNEADVPYQDYYNNSAVRCGSTLGLATSAKLGIKTCDIGIAQLAMHSACETCGSLDIVHMLNCIKAFLSADLRKKV